MISKNYYCRNNKSFEGFVTKKSFSMSITKFSYLQSFFIEIDRQYNVLTTYTKHLQIVLLFMKSFDFGLI